MGGGGRGSCQFTVAMCTYWHWSIAAHHWETLTFDTFFFFFFFHTCRRLALHLSELYKWVHILKITLLFFSRVQVPKTPKRRGLWVCGMYVESMMLSMTVMKMKSLTTVFFFLLVEHGSVFIYWNKDVYRPFSAW